jgi:xanthine/uracil/vitamin C permease (AzgA family)
MVLLLDKVIRPQAALGAVLVAGVIFLAISLTPLRAWLINSIPKSLNLVLVLVSDYS